MIWPSRSQPKSDSSFTNENPKLASQSGNFTKNVNPGLIHTMINLGQGVDQLGINNFREPFDFTYKWHNFSLIRFHEKKSVLTKKCEFFFFFFVRFDEFFLPTFRSSIVRGLSRLRRQTFRKKSQDETDGDGDEVTLRR